MDISGCGRQIFRNCQSSKGRAVLRQLESMKSLDPGETDAYARLIASDKQDGVNTLLGNKHFWRSDMTVHRRPTWYASVKMSSTRVIGAETCNGENLLGLHLGDGVTYFYRTGDEYNDLFPVWDWRRLPGTTCRQDQGSLVPNAKACRGRSNLVGGLSDGERGIAAMEYIRDGLRARKAWFFLDRAVVCLGAGIDCNEPETGADLGESMRLERPRDRLRRSAAARVGEGPTHPQWIEVGPPRWDRIRLPRTHNSDGLRPNAERETGTKSTVVNRHGRWSATCSVSGSTTAANPATPATRTSSCRMWTSRPCRRCAIPCRSRSCNKRPPPWPSQARTASSSKRYSSSRVGWLGARARPSRSRPPAW